MLKFTLAVAATAALATGSLAQTATHTAATRTTTATRSATATPAARPTAARTATRTMSTNTATHTTKSGKTITYDCSKKGNMNKKACKK